MATQANIPIPQNPIGENFAWRDWFQKLSNRVFGTLANQDSSSVVITGGTINGTSIGSATPSTGKFTTLDATTTRTTNLLVGSGTNGQILVGRTSDHAFLPATLGAGTGISITSGAGSLSIANSGVTSVTGTSPVVSSGGATPAISLAASYGDTQNPYASKTANYFLAAPNGSAGVPTFRAVVAADIPTLNQNTTGTALNITATSNNTLTTLSALSLPNTQVTGLGTMSTQNVGISATVALAKLTTIGTNGSLTVSNGIITAYTAPT
jgi:hypothetical protein